ncbi:MAG: histidinol-phosphatase [Rhodospirillales bacterium]
MTFDPSMALLGGDVPEGAMELAIAMADAADAIAARHFRHAFDIEHKADESPVTIADKETESAMRSLIAGRFPDHGILGEEHGDEQLDARHVWVIDPIDGTASFAIGAPVFGSLIALLEDGKPILGVVNCPAMNERWIGARGRPTTLNGAPVRTRTCPDLSAAWHCTTTPAMFERDGEAEAAARLRSRVRRAVWGMDCYAYGLIANGTLDIVCESNLQPYDYMALVPVVEGAGGKITNWQGDPLSLSSGPTVLACGDPGLHDAALALLTG